MKKILVAVITLIIMVPTLSYGARSTISSTLTRSDLNRVVLNPIKLKCDDCPNLSANYANSYSCGVVRPPTIWRPSLQRGVGGITLPNFPTSFTSTPTPMVYYCSEDGKILYSASCITNKVVSTQTRSSSSMEKCVGGKWEKPCGPDELPYPPPPAAPPPTTCTPFNDGTPFGRGVNITGPDAGSPRAYCNRETGEIMIPTCRTPTSSTLREVSEKCPQGQICRKARGGAPQCVAGTLGDATCVERGDDAIITYRNGETTHNLADCVDNRTFRKGVCDENSPDPTIFAHREKACDRNNFCYEGECVPRDSVRCVLIDDQGNPLPTGTPRPPLPSYQVTVNGSSMENRPFCESGHINIPVCNEDGARVGYRSDTCPPDTQCRDGDEKCKPLAHCYE